MPSIQLLLDHAKDVREVIRNNSDAYTVGLCDVLDHHSNYVVKLSSIMDNWPENPDKSAFPVPCPAAYLHVAESDTIYGRSSRCWAYDNLPKYTGEYGAARLRLLDFIISELEKENG